MTQTYLDRLETRGRRYAAVARWTGCVAVFLLGLSPLYAQPPAGDHATFRTIEINPSLADYWPQVGLQVVDLDRRWFGPAPGWLVEILPWVLLAGCVAAAVVFVIRRRVWPLVALALAGDLCLEAATATRSTFGVMTLDPAIMTPVARSWADADAFGRTSDLDRRLLPKGIVITSMNGVVQVTGSFKHEQVRAELHYELMQDAYLRGDAATAARHLEALQRDDLPFRRAADWRLSVMREWLESTEHRPSLGTYRPHTAPPQSERTISFISLVAGLILAAVALPAWLLGLTIRRRAPRLTQLVAQL